MGSLRRESEIYSGGVVLANVDLVFSFFHHFHLLERYGHFPVDLSERGDEQVNYIPGLPPTRLADLIRSGRNDPIQQDFLDALKIAREARYLLLATVYEVDYPAVDAVKASLSFPVFTIGPAIPLSRLADDSCLNEANYLKCLDRQPGDSVLYISLGSFLSVSSSKRDEIAGCLRDSGIRFMWVGQKEAAKLKELCSDRGIVVPWCDQLRVLSHSSVGGFWMHCGWNSILEAVFTGVPMLVYPIAMDQHRNASLVVKDWKIGLGVGTDITGLMRKFMDLEDDESREIRRQAKHLQESPPAPTNGRQSTAHHQHDGHRHRHLPQGGIALSWKRLHQPHDELLQHSWPEPPTSPSPSSSPRAQLVFCATVLNLLLPERVRAQRFSEFVVAVFTKMEAPFEEPLDRLHYRLTISFLGQSAAGFYEVSRRHRFGPWRPRLFLAFITSIFLSKLITSC
ncbi:hypothetical protein NL676_005797 [Syzygium grande]|nr:hypothetical protein NL676_005797 [Syzygium grande]